MIDYNRTNLSSTYHSHKEGHYCAYENNRGRKRRSLICSNDGPVSFTFTSSGLIPSSSRASYGTKKKRRTSEKMSDSFYVVENIISNDDRDDISTYKSRLDSFKAMAATSVVVDSHSTTSPKYDQIDGACTSSYSRPFDSWRTMMEVTQDIEKDIVVENTIPHDVDETPDTTCSVI